MQTRSVGLLFGGSNTVTNVSGQNKITSFSLSGGEVCVWSYNPSLGTTIPRIGDVVSTMGALGQHRIHLRHRPR